LLLAEELAKGIWTSRGALLLNPLQVAFCETWFHQVARACTIKAELVAATNAFCHPSRFAVTLCAFESG